ncbi:hypothetical protein HPC49_28665 [Pyxidicoccus fallax]|uniref:Uncharacterized protein n=1 Tax=Pyxidicoccus fallax TaxID=394095 RepID=A0A848LV10_9BACT|nr:hypothetical protein [Pyxidicoccus fallax]NMO21174.1 hypothetical protein [Pyxidicoccus fallax]NPC82178.1 hypothetical protein [Pyxidicoccus fallax]
MTTRLYMVLIEQGDKAIWDNQQKLIRKTRVGIHDNYECEVHFKGGSWVETMGFRYDLVKPYVGKGDDLFWLRKYMTSLMAAHDRKLITRGHGSLHLYGIMGPACFADFLLDMGLNQDTKIDMTGCSLGVGPNVQPNEIPNKAAEAVGMGSYAQRFQLALYEKRGLRCTVHARTSATTVDDNGRKTTRDPVTGEHVHKGRHSKIIFNIDNTGAQFMLYAYAPSSETGLTELFESPG